MVDWTLLEGQDLRRKMKLLMLNGGHDDLDIVNVDGTIQDAEVNEIEANGENDEEGGWDFEDLEVPSDLDSPRISTNTHTSVFVAPTPGISVSQIWIQKPSLAREHAAARNFDAAMRLLSRQLGIKNLTLLKPMFSGLHIGSQTSLNAFPSATDISTALENGCNESDSPNGRGFPALVFRLSQMEAKFRSAYDYTNKGKFIDALCLFFSILCTIPLIVVDSRSQVDEVKELIEVTREYVLGLKIELSRKETKDNNI